MGRDDEPIQRPKTEEKEHFWGVVLSGGVEGDDDELTSSKPSDFGVSSLSPLDWLNSWLITDVDAVARAPVFASSARTLSSQMRPDEPCLLNEIDDLCNVVIIRSKSVSVFSSFFLFLESVSMFLPFLLLELIYLWRFKKKKLKRVD